MEIGYAPCYNCNWFFYFQLTGEHFDCDNHPTQSCEQWTIDRCGVHCPNCGVLVTHLHIPGSEELVYELPQRVELERKA